MVAVFPENSMTLYMTIMSSLDIIPAKFLYLYFGLLFCGFISGSLNGNALTGQLADVFKNLGSYAMINKVETELHTTFTSSEISLANENYGQCKCQLICVTSIVDS